MRKETTEINGDVNGVLMALRVIVTNGDSYDAKLELDVTVLASSPYNELARRAIGVCDCMACFSNRGDDGSRIAEAQLTPSALGAVATLIASGLPDTPDSDFAWDIVSMIQKYDKNDELSGYLSLAAVKENER